MVQQRSCTTLKDYRECALHYLIILKGVAPLYQGVGCVRPAKPAFFGSHEAINNPTPSVRKSNILAAC